MRLGPVLKNFSNISSKVDIYGKLNCILIYFKNVYFASEAQKLALVLFINALEALAYYVGLTVARFAHCGLAD